MGMEISNAQGDRQGASTKVQTEKSGDQKKPKGFFETFNKLPEDKFRKTSSGLMVTTVKEGNGKSIVTGDKIKVRYTGWLMDGTKFDSSIDRGKTFEFTLGAGRVIKGWEEGLSGMKPGERRQLIIPPSLGYGNRKMGNIPPGSILVFNVEAVSVQGPAANPKGSMTVVA